MGETRGYRYFSHEALKQANVRAIKAGRNRTLDFERLPIEPTKIYPVAMAFPHDRGAAHFEEMRVEIVLNEDGDRAWLDISLSDYDTLPQSEMGTS
jgi:hypothetical protein